MTVPIGTKPIVYTFRKPGKPYPCWVIALPNVTLKGFKHIFLIIPKSYHSKNGLPKKAFSVRAKAESLIDGKRSYLQIAEELQKC